MSTEHTKASCIGRSESLLFKTLAVFFSETLILSGDEHLGQPTKESLNNPAFIC
jgi:hypothetical protein